MTGQSDFGLLQFKMVGIKIVLYAVLCFGSFVTLLHDNLGILSWDAYINFMSSSVVQEIYSSEVYTRLGNGWLPLIIIVPIIVAYSVANWKDAGKSPSEDISGLMAKLVALNFVLMAILMPIGFVGMLANIGILSSDVAFDIIFSDFMLEIYGHEHSWIWTIFPILILGPIILTYFAREWYESPASGPVVTASGDQQTIGY